MVPALTPMLGLASIMPVLLTGRVMPNADTWTGLQFVYDLEALPSTQPSHAEMRLASTVEELYGHEPFDPQAMTEHVLRLRRLVDAYRPSAQGWARTGPDSPELRVWGDRPATAFAYRRLWEDLQALHILKEAPLNGED